MSIDEIIQAKTYRLQELRKYQSYYGPNTPYPVIVEINEIESELRQLLGTKNTRPTRTVKKKWRRQKAPVRRIDLYVSKNV